MAERARLHRILVTGASGYLGGTLLARWAGANLPPATGYDKLFALVRTDAQAQAVRQWLREAPAEVEPLTMNIHEDEGAAVREAIVANGITVVFYLVDAVRSGPQLGMIEALAEVRRRTGLDVHFLHVSMPTNFFLSLSLSLSRLTDRATNRSTGVYLTIDNFQKTTGAKVFSGHAGAPTDRPLLDTDPELYSIQNSKSPPSI